MKRLLACARPEEDQHDATECEDRAEKVLAVGLEAVNDDPQAIDRTMKMPL